MAQSGDKFRGVKEKQAKKAKEAKRQRAAVAGEIAAKGFAKALVGNRAERQQGEAARWSRARAHAQAARDPSARGQRLCRQLSCKTLSPREGQRCQDIARSGVDRGPLRVGQGVAAEGP